MRIRVKWFLALFLITGCFVGVIIWQQWRSRLNASLLKAIEQGNTSAALQYLHQGADANALLVYQNSPRNLRGIFDWITHSRNIFWHEEAVLTLACGYRNPTVAKALLDAGANINARDSNGHTALLSCIEQDPPEITRLLVERGIDVNARDYQGNTALMLLCSNQFASVLSLPILLQGGADASLRNSEGKTAFQLAGESKHTSALEQLRRAGVQK